MFINGIENAHLKQRLEWLKGILHSIHDGVLVVDNQGIVRLINPEYTSITGVSADTIINKHLLEVRPGAQLIETLKNGEKREGIYRKEGNKEYVVDMAPVIVNNKIMGAVSICKGVVEVHRLTTNLKKDRQVFQTIKKKVNDVNKAKYTFQDIIGANGDLLEVIEKSRKVAHSPLTVLINGESGTGKELFAQAIHNESDRCMQPFIPINCAAIPAALIESELFGYEEGSFTNARKGGKAGLFELANKGTIFLDEVCELPYDLQAKLLRVLQEQTIRKVGGVLEKEIDVRIIAATNTDLKKLVEKKRFREDLFYRLNVLSINIPPLRERKNDFHEMVHYMLHPLNKKGNYTRLVKPNYTIDQKALCLLEHHYWPGNIRELKNVINYAIHMTETMNIEVKHLPDYLQKNDLISNQGHTKQTLKDIVEKAESDWIAKTLKDFGNDVEERKKAAEALGISLATLYNKMNKYRIG
ncbi:sigma-54 interaction domain-containing protein [Bacillus chungangensis]|uniref:PAS domain S-box-containing protein n=1 Tax=Bacillus chungangensis TaxID=587633 RepID=A0ABT9WXJ2_9BACI|nr:sigma 54-interacting transcriptional regulator [Bacillus chungangensis]MDQ0178013.1 PAS domain S-box-containing protein [Bacillus chungangensis]